MALAKFKRFLTNNKYLILILCVFSVICISISLVNHYLFRTAALDLGITNQIIYNISHFHAPISTLYTENIEIHFLGDHFSPIFYLFAPFEYLFGSYTLLIIQIVSVLFGGIGVYKYATYKNPGQFFKYFHLLHFLGIWGIFSALAYDFHTNVFAAMLAPWLFYFYEKRENKKFLLIFILMLLCKENMALWMIFILIGLMFKNRNNNLKSILKFELPLLFITIVYFIVVIKYLMPYFSQNEQILQILRYEYLGNTFGEIFTNLISHPIQTFSLLFEIQTKQLEFVGIKSETLFMLIISGGFVFFRYPRYLIMIIPIYAQKMLAVNSIFWGINGQYSIEFVPILAIALVDFIANYPVEKLKKWLLIGVVLLTYYFNSDTLKNRKSFWYNKINSNFYEVSHYKTTHKIDDIYSALKLIPDGEPLSCASELSPHLYNRRGLYYFPRIANAKYIALFKTGGSTYPLTEVEFNAKIAEIIQSPKWELIYDKNNLIILRKK